MRVFLWSNHKYPVGGIVEGGRAASVGVKGGSYVVHDLLAKGLAELGHEVFYLLEGTEGRLPKGVTLVSEPVPDSDILHHYNSQWANDSDFINYRKSFNKRWVTTCHSDPKLWGWHGSIPDNWIFVSQTLARAHSKSRYVLNGVDPAEYEYGAAKGDYFLFLSNFRRDLDKGLDVALALSEKMGFKLVVAGPGADDSLAESVEGMCSKARATYIGEVRNEKKAQLLAGARALLFPTKINEAFGLVMAEALISGTPVICSDRGACTELISPDVGYVCGDLEQYERAINEVDKISPAACRDKALRDYHYLRMAADYVKEYEKEIARFQEST
jgi:glycosyltransferase involved in cell wall biosynthesis